MNSEPMEVVVVGRHLEVPETVKEAAARKADRLGRYLEGMHKAEVCFSNSPPGRLGEPVTCEIVLEGRGHVVRAVGAGGRPGVALDDAIDKAALQLARLKRKLVGRSRPRHNGRRPQAEEAPLAEAMEGAEVESPAAEGVSEP